PHEAIDDPFAPDERTWDIDIKLGARHRVRLAKHDLVAAFSPTLSPDGRQVAFIGLTRGGRKDVYVLDPEQGGRHGTVTRLTDDVYAERHLTWTPDGIVFNSSATVHGHFNLFRVRPEAPGDIEQLTNEPRDHMSPVAMSDGGLVFVAWDRERANL